VFVPQLTVSSLAISSCYKHALQESKKRLTTEQSAFATLQDMKTKHFKHAKQKGTSRTTPSGYTIDAFDWFRNYCELAKAMTTLHAEHISTDTEIKQEEEQKGQLNKLIDFFNIQDDKLKKEGCNVTPIEKKETGCSNKHNEKDSDVEKKPPSDSPRRHSARNHGTVAQVIGA
jgi:hypothetical protein